MPDLASSHLRVAIVSRSVRQRDCLKEILEINGLIVISDERLQQHLPKGINEELADVILVNLDESDDPAIDVLIDQASLPILFNDSSSIRKQATPGGRAWGRRLASKLLELVDGEVSSDQVDEIGEDEFTPREFPAMNSGLHLVSGGVQVDDTLSMEETLDECELSMMADPGTVDLEMDLELDLDFDIGFEKSPETDHASAESADSGELRLEPDFTSESFTPSVVSDFLSVNDISAAYRSEITQEILTEKAAASTLTRNDADVVFVLGASIGGPQAVKPFLSMMPADIKAGFILAQHIGSGFVELLAEQLGRITPLDVITPRDGMRLKNGQLIVVPVDEEISFDAEGCIQLIPVQQRSIYSPSIDDVMVEVARYYGDRAHAVVFSGMGNDGTVGCKAVAAQGGTVWAQTANSCVISSMADSVRKAGLVAESGTPEQLARILRKFIQDEVDA